MVRIHIEKGDITTCQVDAIVNAANSDLILGSGVAGAIARAAGPTVQEESNRHGPIQVGQAAVTGAGLLAARYIIHQASMPLGGKPTPETLRDSTTAALTLAAEHGAKTIAFPAVGTGVGGMALRLSAAIMIEQVREHGAGGTSLTDVYFVLYDENAYEVFKEVLAGSW